MLLTRLQKCGEDVRISDNVEIMRPELMCLGNHISIDSYFYCTAGVTIGDYSHVACATSIIGGSGGSFTAGHFFSMSAGARIICVSNLENGDGLVNPIIPKEFRDRVNSDPVVFGNFVVLGTNAVVMPGVTLGDGVVIGANSFVKHNIGSWEIWAGSPARFIKRYDGSKMKAHAAKMGYQL
jgi:acetyltransferase-like isoleucine patch superfamily enzyme